MRKKRFIPERGELVIVNGKNKKDRVVPVGEIDLKLIQEYIKLVRLGM